MLSTVDQNFLNNTQLQHNQGSLSEKILFLALSCRLAASCSEFFFSIHSQTAFMELLVVGYIHIQVFNKRKSGAMHSFHRIEMIFQQIENMN